MASHLIHRQLIEANFQSKKSALDGQNLLQDRYENVLIPLMEKVFDEFSPKNSPLRIEKLELDLGTFPADLPEKMMRDRLRDVLEDQLRKSTWKKEFSPIPLPLLISIEKYQDHPKVIPTGKRSPFT